MFASVCSICLNWWMVRDFIVLCHHLVYLAFMMFMVITESRENTSSSLWHPQGFNESGIQDLGLVHTHGGGTSQRASEYKKMNDTFLRTLLGGQQRVMTTSERRNKRGRNSALTHVNIRARRQKKKQEEVTTLQECSSLRHCSCRSRLKGGLWWWFSSSTSATDHQSSLFNPIKWSLI
jgi:hypothetical protein